MGFNFSLPQTLSTTRDCFDVHDATGEYCNLHMAHRIFEMAFTTQSTVLTIRYKIWYAECKRSNRLGEKIIPGKWILQHSICTPSARQEVWNLDDLDSRDLSIRTLFEKHQLVKSHLCSTYSTMQG
ncbi:hypothetical protein T02_15146 [Trichinella nativa]|uniref:Uncharacterized protein n=1 Tax=Trichinella nativa TaxID=6335 RepID=A0A0V1KNJ9_9BILA|nr:hypothetical protein T02_15146 [Trichinella nativa]